MPAVVGQINADKHVTCNGGSDGRASISGMGGAGGYTYLWNTGSSSSSITGLMAATYSASVTDANGCKTPSYPVTIDQPSGTSLLFITLYSPLPFSYSPSCKISSQSILILM